MISSLQTLTISSCVCNKDLGHLLLMTRCKGCLICVIVDVSSEIILAFHYLVLSIIVFSTIVS